jgi:hypothetical protein
MIKEASHEPSSRQIASGDDRRSQTQYSAVAGAWCIVQGRSTGVRVEGGGSCARHGRGGTQLAFALGGAAPKPVGEHRQFDDPSGVEILLTTLDTPGRCRLTFRHLAVGRNVSIDCRSEDASTLAELVVRGEQALFDADRTRPALRRVTG